MGIDFWELMQKDEELLPELLPYVAVGPVGQMIHHPLVIEPVYDPKKAAYINCRFKQLTKRTQEAFSEKDYSKYLAFHERPYRFEAFLECVEDGLSGRPYWETLSRLWQDTENMHENQAGWKKLWSKKIPGREHVMDDEEKAKLLTMPETFWVWRGGNRPEMINDCKGGMCWTLDKKKAVWFSK